MPDEIVGSRGLLNPVQPFLVEDAYPLQRPSHRKGLVEVHRDHRALADNATQHAYGLQVLGHASAPDLDLVRVETLLRELTGLLDHALWAHGAEAAVGGDPLLLTTQQLNERQLESPRQGVPGCHVYSGGGDAGKTLRSQETEHALQLALNLERRYRVALKYGT